MNDKFFRRKILKVNVNIYKRIPSITPKRKGRFGFWGTNCSSLTSVYISDLTAWCNIKFYDLYSNPLEIGADLYLNDNLITDLVIPDGTTSIGDSVFVNCSSLTSVTIPDSVTSIRGRAFANCSSLTSVTIPNSVTSIGGAAFANCSSLTSVTIPDSVTSIGGRAFTGCENLASVTFANTNDWYYTNSIDYAGGTAIDVTDTAQNATYLKSTYNEKYWYKYLETTVTVTADNVTDVISKLSNGGNHTIKVTGAITDGTILSIQSVLQNNKGTMVNLDLSGTTGLTSISNEGFENCTSLASVTIPDSVTSIGSYAFYGCRSLTSMTIPDSVTSIGSSAFSGCYSLTKVTIPDSVTSIGSYAFYGCSSLTSVTIPDSVTSIGSSAFNGCSSLTTVNYKGTQEQWGQISIYSYNGNLTDATINYNYTGE